MNHPESAESYSIAEQETRIGRGRSEGANHSTSRLPPSTNHTPLTKGQIKRRTFWVNFFLFVCSIGVWVVAALIAINKHK